MSNGRSRLVTITLVCSLAINLLLVGAIIGRVISGPPPRPLPDHLGWIFRSLDEDKRRELRSEFEKHARAALPMRREIRNAQRAFEAAVASPDFSEDEVRAALAKLRDTSGTYQERAHEEMVRVLGRLTAEERQRVVEFLQRRDHERREFRRSGDGNRTGKEPRMEGQPP